MSGLPNSEALESWGWDSVERLLIGSAAGLGYLVKSLPSTDSNKDAVGIAIQSAQGTEGDPPTTTTTATLLGSVTLPLESDALQDAGSLLKNVGNLTGANLTAGEVCPPSPAGPALPTIPAEVDSLEKLFVWSALTLNASLYPEALTYIQISPAYGESLLSIQISWPLDAEVLALNGGNFVAAAQRLALTYAVLDGSTGSSGGVVLPPPVQYWGVPVADLAALGALLTQSPGMSRFVVSEGTFYTLLAELPDGESLDGLNFVAGQGDTVWRRVGEVGPAGPAGSPGSDGSPGADGQDGVDGLSAYQIAVNNGFVGTEAQWLASLVGADGSDGLIGADGADGLSAYQIAVNNGFVGTEPEWLASLEGAQGPAGLPGAGLDWQGAWDVATNYLINDAVSYGGSSWIANADHVGKTPGVDPEWDLWVSKGETGPAGSPGVAGQDGADGADGLDAGFTLTATKTANYTAVSGERVVCDTSGGGFVVTPPASGRFGVLDLVGVSPTTGFGAVGKNLTITPASGTVMGGASLVLDVGAVSPEFELVGSDWKIVNHG